MKRILKLWYFRLKFYSKKVTFANGCYIAINSTFEGYNSVGENVIFGGVLGLGSYIGKNTNLSGKVGRYCSIGADVRVLTGTHPLSNFVSTSPVFYSLWKQCNFTFVKEQYFEEYLYADKVNKFGIIVGNDVWIGAGVTIMGGIIIGDGAVILPNATVVKDIPPYSIVGGVPAKIIKMRFDNDTINFLLELKWWNQPIDWLQKNALFFHNIEEFKNKFKNSI